MPPGLIAAIGPVGSEPTLVEILDRVLDRGIVVAGEVKISLADIDLIHVGLQLIVCSADRAAALQAEARAARLGTAIQAPGVADA